MFTFTTYTPIFSQKTPKIGTKSGQFGQNSENHEFTPKIGATNNTALISFPKKATPAKRFEINQWPQSITIEAKFKAEL